MRVLAIDTALGACQAAVLDAGEVRATRSELMDRGHQERLAPMVAEVLEQARLGARDLDRIGVTVGPGSFTGLRVGLAFAKGLSLGGGPPCVGVGSLEALAASHADGWAAAVIDARRERVYLQVFRNGVPASAPELVDVAEADRRLADTPGVVLVGPGAALLPGSERRIVSAASPDIAAVARLTASAPQPLGRPAPLYLREADARTIAERAAAAGAS